MDLLLGDPMRRYKHSTVTDWGSNDTQLYQEHTHKKPHESFLDNKERQLSASFYLSVCLKLTRLLKARESLAQIGSILRMYPHWLISLGPV